MFKRAKEEKGGINDRPKTKRPSPPKGQGGSQSEILKLSVAPAPDENEEKEQKKIDGDERFKKEEVIGKQFDRRNRKETRRAKRLKLLHDLKTFIPSSISVLMYGINVILDYVFNLFTMACIVYVIYYGIDFLLNGGDIYRAGVSLVFLVVLVWINEKIH